MTAVYDMPTLPRSSIRIHYTYSTEEEIDRFVHIIDKVGTASNLAYSSMWVSTWMRVYRASLEITRSPPLPYPDARYAPTNTIQDISGLINYETFLDAFRLQDESLPLKPDQRK